MDCFAQTLYRFLDTGLPQILRASRPPPSLPPSSSRASGRSCPTWRPSWLAPPSSSRSPTPMGEVLRQSGQECVGPGESLRGQVAHECRKRARKGMDGSLKESPTGRLSVLCVIGQSKAPHNPPILLHPPLGGSTPAARLQRLQEPQLQSNSRQSGSGGRRWRRGKQSRYGCVRDGTWGQEEVQSIVLVWISPLSFTHLFLKNFGTFCIMELTQTFAVRIGSSCCSVPGRV